MFALDANTIIHAFQGRGNVAARLAAVSPDQIAVPSIALYEVEQGVLRCNNVSRRQRQLAELIRVCRILPFDARAASAGARLRIDLERLGSKIGPLDTLIAAMTLVNGAILVTNNTREFGKVPGLVLENWFR